jgi:hypothetical protein
MNSADLLVPFSGRDKRATRYWNEDVWAFLREGPIVYSHVSYVVHLS